MADIEVPKNLYLETDCDHKDDSHHEPPLPTSLDVRCKEYALNQNHHESRGNMERNV